MSVGGVLLKGIADVLGEKPVTMLLHHKSHLDWSGIEPGPLLLSYLI